MDFTPSLSVNRGPGARVCSGEIVSSNPLSSAIGLSTNQPPRHGSVELSREPGDMRFAKSSQGWSCASGPIWAQVAAILEGEWRNIGVSSQPRSLPNAAGVRVPTVSSHLITGEEAIATHLILRVVAFAETMRIIPQTDEPGTDLETFDEAVRGLARLGRRAAHQPHLGTRSVGSAAGASRHSRAVRHRRLPHPSGGVGPTQRVPR